MSIEGPLESLKQDNRADYQFKYKGFAGAPRRCVMFVAIIAHHYHGVLKNLPKEIKRY
ncbi:MAG: hypothetical protein ACKO96_11725 [Flammeovirgaceae bacterium]